MDNQIKMKDMPDLERPYEKLELQGADALSDSELLAIIIKTGSKSEKVTDIALRVLKAHPSGLVGVSYLTLEELRTIKGIGRVKAIQLKAVAELSKRMSKAKRKVSVNVHSPRTVADFYMESMRHLDREHMKVIMLDTKHNIIGDTTLSVGTVNASLVHPREVFLYALKLNAVSIILMHNHPSGDSNPSHEDIQVTKRISEAGSIIGINLLDHIVIGDMTYSSLKELGYL